MSNTPLIELVCHCYAEAIPDFAALLNCQLSSLYLHPPEHCRVRVTVCQTPTDELTFHVAREFAFHFDDQRLPVQVIQRMYGKHELFRRGLARNDVAKRTKADVVWFSDADYLFGPGCLDTLASLSREGFPALLVFPREVKIQVSHAVGDAEIARVVPGEPFQVDLSQFVPRREKMAIGGLQIVSGETARKYGYCDGSKWVRPVDEAGGFRNTTEDKVYRRTFDGLGGSAAVDLPGVHRMRHSRSQWESQENRLRQTSEKK